MDAAAQATPTAVMSFINGDISYSGKDPFLGRAQEGLSAGEGAAAAAVQPVSGEGACGSMQSRSSEQADPHRARLSQLSFQLTS